METNGDAQKRNAARSRDRPGNPSFCAGNHVMLSDKTHAMYGKRGVVVSHRYIGCGVTDMYEVIVEFEDVPPGLVKLWQFLQTDLHIMPAEEVSAPFSRKVRT